MNAIVFNPRTDLTYSTTPRIIMDGTIVEIVWDDRECEYTVVLNSDDLLNLLKRVISARNE